MASRYVFIHRKPEHFVENMDHLRSIGNRLVMVFCGPNLR
jgi:hypothetical protein